MDLFFIYDMSSFYSAGQFINALLKIHSSICIVLALWYWAIFFLFKYKHHLSGGSNGNLYKWFKLVCKYKVQKKLDMVLYKHLIIYVVCAFSFTLFPLINSSPDDWLKHSYIKNVYTFSVTIAEYQT